MAILGLVQTENFDRFNNYRRSVAYFYPNGAAPLVGVLSLLDEETTNDPKFFWFEKRLVTQQTLTITSGSSLGPLTDSGGTATSDPSTIVQGTSYRLYVASDARDTFRVGHVFRAVLDNHDATGTVELKGVVTAVSTTYVAFTAITAHNVGALNRPKNGSSSENVGKEVWIVGSAFNQGVVDQSSGIWNQPVEIGNYTQIFRSPFSITGSALKTSAKYDETGPYKDQAKETSVLNMIEMEKAFIFGERYLNTSGATPLYMTGGILWFLKQFELGNTSNGGAFQYRVGGSAATADTDDNKRIITNSGGYLNEKLYDGYLERLFRVTNNKSNEKLVLCGSGFLSVINQMYRSKTVLNAQQGKETPFGMPVVTHVTSFGTVHYRSHPLFSQHDVWRYNALALDVHNLKYTYLSGRDTALLTNRQPPDADYRKDEYLTEAGLRLMFPESHMLLQNVADYRP